jgi:hypothetical protein
VYSKGGRRFWIHNTAPLGCLPYVLDRFPVPASQIDNHGCAIPRNEIARYYNSELKRRVIELRKELSEAAFTYVDIYSIKLTLITQAKKLGILQAFYHVLVTRARFRLVLMVYYMLSLVV